MIMWSIEEDTDIKVIALFFCVIGAVAIVWGIYYFLSGQYDKDQADKCVFTAEYEGAITNPACMHYLDKTTLDKLKKI